MEATSCQACGGPLNAESETVYVTADITMSADECKFEPNEFDQFTCANDGWLKIEHEAFSEGQPVHGSCFLDHDDVLSEDD